MPIITNRRTTATLFTDPENIHSHRVRLILAEKNITVDIIEVDPSDIGEEVAEVNPYGTLPTLIDRDLAVYDSGIIMEYLDERYPHPPLLPIDPVSRANTRIALHRIEKDWYSLAEVILKRGRSATKARKELTEQLLSSSPLFSAKPWFMSDEYTLADASIAPLFWRMPQLGIELKGAGSKDVMAYATRLFKHPNFGKSLTEAERELRKSQ